MNSEMLLSEMLLKIVVVSLILMVEVNVDNSSSSLRLYFSSPSELLLYF
ncbi:hypothetical protein H6F38_20940 [Paenibacillus sp. EKM208P]|nr:hypothetical protein [Paenibacillus polymyxa]KAF6628252.1 hypothetical protein H6F38_20940 [Paenibacillus sp. EKM208P]WCM63682.1 hypothetical protein OYT09_12440 [Paenibacillus polymyxa]